jgi:hypothetical protein
MEAPWISECAARGCRNRPLDVDRRHRRPVLGRSEEVTGYIVPEITRDLLRGSDD